MAIADTATRSDNWQAWTAEVQAAADHPAQWPQLLGPLRDRLWRLCKVPQGGSTALRQLWATADHQLQAVWLAPLLEGQDLPTDFRRALAILAGTLPDRASNAALQILGHGEHIDSAGWQAVGKRALAQRPAIAPESDCAVFLARHGPPQAFASVALTAFRHGPDDADDRLVALGQLGRFADSRSVGWYLRVADIGAAHMEVIQAAALALAAGGDKQAWTGVLVRSAGCAHGLDAWARWTALEGLVFHLGAEALPFALAALHAAGDDLPDGYLQGVTTHVVQLDGNQKLDSASLTVAGQRLNAPSWPPLPGLRQRVDSRDARVAREAAFVWEQNGSDPKVLQQRAAVECALMQAKVLIGSLLAPTDPAALDLAAWSTISSAVSAVDRDRLQEQERQWLTGS